MDKDRKVLPVFPELGSIFPVKSLQQPSIVLQLESALSDCDNSEKAVLDLKGAIKKLDEMLIIHQIHKLSR